jgi:hypothetical protein
MKRSNNGGGATLGVARIDLREFKEWAMEQALEAQGAGSSGANNLPSSKRKSTAVCGYQWMSLSPASMDELSRTKITKGSHSSSGSGSSSSSSGSGGGSGWLKGLAGLAGRSSHADEWQSRTVAPNGRLLVAVASVREFERKSDVCFV